MLPPTSSKSDYYLNFSHIYNPMILEVAILDVIQGRERSFEKTFAIAQNIISNMPGFRNLQLQRCIEKNNRYILLVHWDTLEDHTVGFRRSKQYEEWKKLLHEYYDPFPEVQHYELIPSLG